MGPINTRKTHRTGLNDTILFSSVAIGSLGSGIAYEFIGWETMNWIAFPVGVSCLAALFLLHQRGVLPAKLAENY